MNRVYIDSFDKKLLDVIQTGYAGIIKDENVYAKIENTIDFEVKVAQLFARDVKRKAGIHISSVPFTMLENTFGLNDSSIFYSMGTNTRMNSHYLNRLEDGKDYYIIVGDIPEKFIPLIDGFNRRYNINLINDVDNYNIIRKLKAEVQRCLK